MQRVFVVTDTNIFRYVAETDFKHQFLKTCQKLSIQIVTSFWVEWEIENDPPCQVVFSFLRDNGIIHNYSTPDKLKDQESDVYMTLKARMDDADASAIPVALLNKWILLTNDDEAIAVFRGAYPHLLRRLKLMSFESFLYLSYQQGIINEEQGEIILGNYKKKCFESEQRQNWRIRGRNFVEMITFLHEKGVSPVEYFS